MMKHTQEVQDTYNALNTAKEAADAAENEVLFAEGMRDSCNAALSYALEAYADACERARAEAEAPTCPPPPPPKFVVMHGSPLSVHGLMSMDKKFVVMHGSPLTGLTVHGPFDSPLAAGDWADQNLAREYDYWVTPMTATIGDQT